MTVRFIIGSTWTECWEIWDTLVNVGVLQPRLKMSRRRSQRFSCTRVISKVLSVVEAARKVALLLSILQQRPKRDIQDLFSGCLLVAPLMKEVWMRISPCFCNGVTKFFYPLGPKISQTVLKAIGENPRKVDSLFLAESSKKSKLISLNLMCLLGMILKLRVPIRAYWG